MPTYSGMNSVDMKDEPTSFESSQEWSIYKATSLLTGPVSPYDDQELFGQTEMDFSSFYDMQPKTIKAEAVELLPPDLQHYGDWQSKHIDHWTPHDCLFWLIHELQGLNLGQSLPEVKMEKLAHIDGATLKQLTVSDFSRMFPEYGYELFNRLQRFKAPFIYNSYYSFDHWSNTTLQADEPFSRYMNMPEESHTLTNLDNESPRLPLLSSGPNPYSSMSEAESGYKSDSSIEAPKMEHTPPPEKRRPGRPRSTKRKKKPEKLGRLWEFIRDLLLNPMYNPSMICWENYDEGTFRFVHSDRVAKLWGSKKDNVDMNYEKLSRAMRYYYKSQVLLPVYGKRLVYKFGPTATGWKSDRPIFRQG